MLRLKVISRLQGGTVSHYNKPVPNAIISIILGNAPWTLKLRNL